jgi:hypothetical protein
MVLLKLLKGIKHNPFTKLGDRPPACYTSLPFNKMQTVHSRMPLKMCLI